MRSKALGELALPGADLERRLMATLDVVRSCTSEVDLEACVAAVASGERLRLDPVRSARLGFGDDRLGVVAGFRQG